MNPTASSEPQSTPTSTLVSRAMVTAIATTLALAAGLAAAAETKAASASKPSPRTATKPPTPNPGVVTNTSASANATTSPAAATTDDRADIDRSTITGSRELPKVLLIVPWKKPVPGELTGRPESSVLDEALAPVDRDVFRRQLDYDAQARRRDPNGAVR